MAILPFFFVLGGICTGFLSLAYLGSETTLLLYSSIGVFMGIFAKNRRRARTVIAAILITVGAALFPKQGELYCIIHTPPGENYRTYFQEGVDGVIVTYRSEGQMVNYINGTMQGGRPGYGFRFETIETMSYAKKTHGVLVIGYGTGTVTETVLKLDEVHKVTIIELSHTLLENMNKMPELRQALADPRTELVVDDARRYLLRTDDKYDVILISLEDAAMSYSNNLYSQEFFQLAARHLHHGGVLQLWLPERKVISNTVRSVFKHVLVYDYFCLASEQPYFGTSPHRFAVLTCPMKGQGNGRQRLFRPS